MQDHSGKKYPYPRIGHTQIIGKLFGGGNAAKGALPERVCFLFCHVYAPLCNGKDAHKARDLKDLHDLRAHPCDEQLAAISLDAARSTRSPALDMY